MAAGDPSSSARTQVLGGCLSPRLRVWLSLSHQSRDLVSVLGTPLPPGGPACPACCPCALGPARPAVPSLRRGLGTRSSQRSGHPGVGSDSGERGGVSPGLRGPRLVPVRPSFTVGRGVFAGGSEGSGTRPPGSQVHPGPRRSVRVRRERRDPQGEERARLGPGGSCPGRARWGRVLTLMLLSGGKAPTRPTVPGQRYSQFSGDQRGPAGTRAGSPGWAGRRQARAWGSGEGGEQAGAWLLESFEGLRGQGHPGARDLPGAAAEVVALSARRNRRG